MQSRQMITPTIKTAIRPYSTFLCSFFTVTMSFIMFELIRDKNVVAEEIPDASTPDRTIIPRIAGIIFMDAQINA